MHYKGESALVHDWREIDVCLQDEKFTGEKGKQGKKGPRETKLQKTESLNVPVKLGGSCSAVGCVTCTKNFINTD